MGKDTDRQYFLIREVDVSNKADFADNEQIIEVAEEGDWLVGHLGYGDHNPTRLANEYLEGWGTAYYISSPIGGGGAYIAYENGDYGVERKSSNGFRGSYHYIQKYIRTYNGHTDLPESLPTSEFDIDAPPY